MQPIVKLWGEYISIPSGVGTPAHCKYIAICSIDLMVDDFHRFDSFFNFEIDNLSSGTFFFFHPHKNSYLLFHPRFSLILFILLVFKLIVILFGVKAAWYFYYGKCSLAQQFGVSQIL